MTVEEIKSAVDKGQKVHWKNGAYTVLYAGKVGYVIKHSNGAAIGLTWADETTLNGKEEDFFIEK